MKRYTYGVTEKGKRLGEAHQNAKLSDADVERIRDIYEEGMTSYQTLATKFGVSKSTIADICTYRKRSTTPSGYRTVKEHEMKRKPPKSRFLDDEPILDEQDAEFEIEELLGLSGYQAQRLRDEDMD